MYAMYRYNVRAFSQYNGVTHVKLGQLETLSAGKTFQNTFPPLPPRDVSIHNLTSLTALSSQAFRHEIGEVAGVLAMPRFSLYTIMY